MQYEFIKCKLTAGTKYGKRTMQHSNAGCKGRR